MLSTVDCNANTTLSKDDKYHILLIYLIEDNGRYGGAYYELFSHLTGGVIGESRETIVDNAYESLEECMADQDPIPFSIKNIKESVVFDIVECLNDEEFDRALDLQSEGRSCEEIHQAVSQ